jgi:hypothetical protein
MFGAAIRHVLETTLSEKRRDDWSRLGNRTFTHESILKTVCAREPAEKRHKARSRTTQ